MSQSTSMLGDWASFFLDDKEFVEFTDQLEKQMLLDPVDIAPQIEFTACQGDTTPCSCSNTYFISKKFIDDLNPVYPHTLPPPELQLPQPSPPRRRSSPKSERETKNTMILINQLFVVKKKSKTMSRLKVLPPQRRSITRRKTFHFKALRC